MASTDPLRDQLQRALGDAYLLERELGGGGMSRVFVAREKALGRDVVVKVLPPDMAGHVSAERFTREIQTAAQLQHPHIVPLLAAGADGELRYYTMPLVRGETLRERLRREGALPIADVTRILAEVFDALAHAHEHSVVHRDIKPENILLSKRHALVTDFGVAKAIGAFEEGSPAITSAGMAVGTIAYASPEQAMGDPTDHRADLYSVGMVGYEMLAGESPFAGRTAQAMVAAHAIEKPVPIERRRADIPPMLAAIVMRCLEKRPEDRPQTAEEAHRLLATLPTPGTGAQPILPLSRWRRVPRRARIASVSAVALLSIAGGTLELAPRDLKATVWTLLSRGGPRLEAQRLVVAPFENRTGDPALDALGDMAAEWITQGLSRLPGVEAVDARTALFTSKVVAEIPSILRASQTARALAEEVGAATVVLGTIYRDSDSLRFQAQALDVASGRQLHTIAPVSGPARRPNAVVERLRDRVVGALASLLDPAHPEWAESTAPAPSYEAYREFAQGVTASVFKEPGYETVVKAHYARAAALDSTYGMPLVAAAYLYVERAYSRDTGAWQRADSVARLAERRRTWLSPGDAAFLDFVRASISGSTPEMLRTAQAMVRFFPGSAEFAILTASVATRLGRYALAREILRGTDPRRGINLATSLYYDYLQRPLHLMGDFRALADTTRAARRQFPEEQLLALRQAQSFGAQGRADEIERLHADDRLVAAERREGGPRTALFAVRELRWHGYEPLALRVVSRLVGEQRAMPLDTAGPAGLARKRSLVRLRIAAGQWSEARIIAAQLSAREPNSLEALAVVGATAAQAGDRAEAERISALIEKRTSAESLHHGYEVSHGAFLRAQIATSLGDRDAAVTLLTRALAQGHYGPWNIHDDEWADFFLPLRDYAPFQQLMAPRS